MNLHHKDLCPHKKKVTFQSKVGKLCSDCTLYLHLKYNLLFFSLLHRPPRWSAGRAHAHTHTHTHTHTRMLSGCSGVRFVLLVTDWQQSSDSLSLGEFRVYLPVRCNWTPPHIFTRPCTCQANHNCFIEWADREASAVHTFRCSDFQQNNKLRSNCSAQCWSKDCVTASLTSCFKSFHKHIALIWEHLQPGSHFSLLKIGPSLTETCMYRLALRFVTLISCLSVFVVRGLFNIYWYRPLEIKNKQMY